MDINVNVARRAYTIQFVAAEGRPPFDDRTFPFTRDEVVRLLALARAEAELVAPNEVVVANSALKIIVRPVKVTRRAAFTIFAPEAGR